MDNFIVCLWKEISVFNFDIGDLVSPIILAKLIHFRRNIWGYFNTRSCHELCEKSSIIEGILKLVGKECLQWRIPSENGSEKADKCFTCQEEKSEIQVNDDDTTLWVLNYTMKFLYCSPDALLSCLLWWRSLDWKSRGDVLSFVWRVTRETHREASMSPSCVLNKVFAQKLHQTNCVKERKKDRKSSSRRK